MTDAVMDEAMIQRLRGSILRAAGQVCSAVKRVYVHESRFEELVGKFKVEFNKVVVGHGIHPDTTMGPLNNKAQFDFVNELLARTAESGAQITSLCKKLDAES